MCLLKCRSNYGTDLTHWPSQLEKIVDLILTLVYIFTCVKGGSTFISVSLVVVCLFVCQQIIQKISWWIFMQRHVSQSWWSVMWSTLTSASYASSCVNFSVVCGKMVRKVYVAQKSSCWHLWLKQMPLCLTCYFGKCSWYPIFNYPCEIGQ